MVQLLASASVTQLLTHAGWVAKGVLLILLAFSLISWSIMIDRYLSYRKLGKRSRDFYEVLRSSSNVTEMVATAKHSKDSPLKEMFVETYRELHDQVKDQLTLPTSRQVGESPTESHLQMRHTENLERTLQRVMRDRTIILETGLAFLATTAAATPFIGLFGTVWGIMDAFQGIGHAGSATLASVAPGISDALVTTAGGLFAAIPALLGYNLLGRKVKTFNAYMEQFALDLINFLTNRFS